MEHPESFETEQQAHAFAEAAGLEHYKIEPRPESVDDPMPLGAQSVIPAIRFFIEYEV
ncbi:hypothetical protein WAE61_00255 [Comamonadaceae bacterium PP-2]